MSLIYVYAILSVFFIGISAQGTQSPIYQATKAQLGQCKVLLTACQAKCMNGGTWNTTRHQCDCPLTHAGLRCERFPIDCTEVSSDSGTGDMDITIQPKNSQPITVRCVLGGCGWTVLERRGLYYRGNTPVLSFNRTWGEYKQPFGNTDREHFIGLDGMSSVLDQGVYKLSVGINGGQGYYHDFRIGDESDKYRMEYSTFSPWPGNPLADGFSSNDINGAQFCTRDNDCGGCGADTGSGWWFGSTCTGGNLHLPPAGTLDLGSWVAMTIANSYMMVQRQCLTRGRPFLTELRPLLLKWEQSVVKLQTKQNSRDSLIVQLFVRTFSKLRAKPIFLKLQNKSLAKLKRDCLDLLSSVIPLPTRFGPLLSLLGTMIIKCGNILYDFGYVIKSFGGWCRSASGLRSIGDILARIGHLLCSCANAIKELGDILEKVGKDPSKLYMYLSNIARLLHHIGECLGKIGALIKRLANYILGWGLSFLSKFIECMAEILFRFCESFHGFANIMETMNSDILHEMFSDFTDVLDHIASLLKRMGSSIRIFFNLNMTPSVVDPLTDYFICFFKALSQLGGVTDLTGRILDRVSFALKTYGLP